MGCSSAFASRTKEDNSDDSLNVIENEIQQIQTKIEELKGKYKDNIEAALIDPTKKEIDDLEAQLENKLTQAETKIQEMKDDDSAKKAREEKLNNLKSTVSELVETNKDILKKNLTDEPAS